HVLQPKVGRYTSCSWDTSWYREVSVKSLRFPTPVFSVVETLATQRHCPQCGAPRQSKGAHHTVLRTVFGDLPITSPRFTHCPCQPQATASFSPLATLLPERTTPELLYLETKWASLASYGITVKLLQDVLPFDAPLAAVTIRNHVCT